MSNQKPNAFDEPILKHKKGLKLDNKSSTVKPAEPNGKDVFDEKAQAVISQYEAYKQRMFDLTTKFKSFIEDKVLPENKTIITKDLEKEVLNNLANLGSDIDADENQPVGGGVLLCRLAMGHMLIQRDIINSLAFKVEKLERRIALLEASKKQDIDIQTNENR